MMGNKMDKCIENLKIFAKRMFFAGEIQMADELADIVEYLESLPQLGKDTNVRSKWIPCSERLPKEDGKYLVSTDGTFGIDVIDIARFENDEWFKSCKIIAWQPLPEPYKEV